MEIKLQRAVPVYLKVDKQTRLLYATAAAAVELLAEEQIAFTAADRILPAGRRQLARLYCSAYPRDD